MESEADKSGELATLIHKTIVSAPEELAKYAFASLLRVLVFHTKVCDWPLEKIEKESINAIQYYFENDNPPGGY